MEALTLTATTGRHKEEIDLFHLTAKQLAAHSVLGRLVYFRNLPDEVK